MQRHYVRKAGKENNSFAGNIPASNLRTEDIDEKLCVMVDNQGHREHTCAEIAEYCGMSKQAVHQIQQRALRKIANKHSELKDELCTPIYEGKELTWYE